MVEVGKTYKNQLNHTAYVTAVCGQQVYYTDQFGCHHHKAVTQFILFYLGCDAYYEYKWGTRAYEDWRQRTAKAFYAI